MFSGLNAEHTLNDGVIRRASAVIISGLNSVPEPLSVEHRFQ